MGPDLRKIQRGQRQNKGETEGKARFTRDTGLTQSEDFMQKKAKYDEIEEQVRSRVVKV